MSAITFKDIRNALGVALWFMFLTFPLLVIKVNPVEKTIIWRWPNLLMVGAAGFSIYLFTRMFLARSAARQERIRLGLEPATRPWNLQFLRQPQLLLPLLGTVTLLLLAFPSFFSTYQVSIMITALMYVVLGLGLNIVVGVAGLLDLGYVAFYAVGAYAYALLHLHFGL